MMSMEALDPVKDQNVSAEWRRYGLARRRELLENDRQNGGTSFNINQTCSVNRYFQVASRALEQFHDMHLTGADLEETYIMGHRMLNFLTESMPNHPEYIRPESASLRMQCREQLELLREVLFDLELQIDEEQCNRFVADFDPIVDDDDDSDDEDDLPILNPNQTQDWVDFAAWRDSQRKSDSPTSETVTTSGTGSLDHLDTSSDESDRDVERKLNFSDYEGPDASPQRMYTMELDSDFLDRIANEDVTYETDSEAADSWAQDNDSVARSSSSGPGITCDPARLVFNDLLRRASPSSQSETVMEAPKAVRAASPCKKPEKGQRRVQFRIADEDEVETEIQRFLNSSDEQDPEIFIESSMQKLSLSTGSPSPKSPPREEARSSSPRSPSAFSSISSVEINDSKISLDEQVAFFGDDDWVSFDGDDTMKSLSFSF